MVLTFITTLIVTASLICVTDSLIFKFAPKYAVMMSATGEATYLYVYKYDSVVEMHPLEILHKEKIEPGILSFMNKPEEVSKIFEPKLNTARSKIPEDDWRLTPIVFKVTEELWLEPSVTFNNIFYHLRRVFANSKFYFKRDWVGILRLKDEVHFNWYLANTHDVHKISINKVKWTKPILYVSNSATHIGYERIKKKRLAKKNLQEVAENVISLLTEKRHPVYKKSYLGYGLYSARKEILMNDSGLFRNEKEIVEVKSGCIKVRNAFTWDYMGTKYIISQGTTYEDEEKCKNLVLRFIKSMNIQKQPKIKKGMIYIRSHIADYAIEFNLARKNFDVIKVEDFTKTRETECNNPNENKPFACLDLTFISLLLTTGFGLQPTTQLVIANESKYIEMHWTGYYTYHLAKMIISDQRHKVTKYFVLMSATGEATYLYVYETTLSKYGYPLHILYKEKIEPGILNFINNAKEVAKIFEPSLEKARSVIPRWHWETTPIIFKAIEELWFEPEVTYNNIFYYLRRLFSKAKFLYEPQSVLLLGYRDEVLYNWYFTNKLLTHNFREEKIEGSKSLPILYITNTATQIGFAPEKDKKILQKDSEYIKVPVNELRILLYYKSYLGYGLYTARKEILMHNSGLFYHEKEVLDVSSDCIKVKTSFTWEYMGTKYSISQAPTYEEENTCEHIISKFIKSMNIYKPIEIKRKHIYIRSHIADYAVEFGLAQRSCDELIVEDLIKINRTVCQIPKEDKPFACLDLTFITMLLIEGFGLRHHTKLIIVTPQAEFNWTAYYAFNLAHSNFFTIYASKLSAYEYR